VSDVSEGADRGQSDATAEPLSPELALIDPVLAEQARARLPDRVQRAPGARGDESWPAERQRVSKTTRALRIAAALVLVGTLVSPGLVFLTRGGEDAPTAGEPSRTLVWEAVAGAEAYEVVLYRGERTVITTRVSRPRLAVPPDVSGEAGVYRWTVRPLVRRGASLQRGRAIVDVKLVVPR
jgi:hypothetical protein